MRCQIVAIEILVNLEELIHNPVEDNFGIPVPIVGNLDERTRIHAVRIGADGMIVQRFV
jgi:hypothetical protein